MSVVIVSALPLFSCGKTEREVKKREIASDDSYFEAEYVTYADEVVGESDSVIPVVIDPQHRVFFQGYDEDHNELRRVIDVNTVTDETYVVDCLDYIEADNCRVDFNTCFIDDDQLYVSLCFCGETGNENKIYRYDKDTNSFADELTVSFDDKYDSPIIVKAFKNEDMIYLEFNYLEGVIYKYGLKVISIDGEQYYENVFDEVLTDWIVEEDGNIVAKLHEQNGPKVSDQFVSVDPLDGTVTSMEIPADDMAKYCTGVLMADACIYSDTVEMTITKYDLHTREYQVIMDFNCCDANINEIENSSLLFCSEEQLILVNSVTGIDRPCRLNSLIELTRLDHNPNAGKKILYAAPYDSIRYVDAEAVREFNKSSEEYYICITMDYSVLTMELPYSYNEDGLITKYRLDQAVLGQLEQDIINGDGPDILLDFGEFFELNDPLYLSGANSFIDSEQGINRDDYFDNIMRAFENDGELYQIPLSVFVTGLYIPEEDCVNGRAGFTYDEYRAFVEECCSGNDPIDHTYSRGAAFDILFSYNSSSFFDADGHIDLSNEAFYNLVDYTEGLGPDSNLNPSDQYQASRTALFMGILNDLYYMNISTIPYVLCGFPSDDNSKGPMASIIDSVAITSCCEYDDIAFEFVKTCLSYDIQKRTFGTNPINRQAYYDYANRILPLANQYIESMTGVSDYYPATVVDEYASYLSSANVCPKIDPQALVIVYEELQAFYNGDKSIDEVIGIIENRINNMVDEKSD